MILPYCVIGSVKSYTVKCHSSHPIFIVNKTQIKDKIYLLLFIVKTRDRRMLIGCKESRGVEWYMVIGFKMSCDMWRQTGIGCKKSHGTGAHAPLQTYRTNIFYLFVF